MNNKFLTTKQQEELSAKNWNVTREGSYLTLYKEDFGNNNAWEEICNQLDVDKRSEQVDILFFGVQSDY